MKPFLFLILFISVIIPSPAQKLPDGHILQYAQKFNGNKGLGDFWFSHSSLWGISKLQNNYFLELSRHTFTGPQTISLPPNRAILKNRIFGDFVLEADVKPSASESGSGEVCFFLGLKDSTKYYFIVLSTDSTDEAQGIYLVKNSVKTQLTLSLSSSTPLKENEWQKIRIERNIVKRTIRVFAGNPAQPLMEVTDYELVMGSVGFGSLQSAACFDNLSVWAPTVIDGE
jgi:hypothetical protein